jgi:hypothetical protein
MQQVSFGACAAGALLRQPAKTFHLNGETALRFRTLAMCALVVTACEAPADGSDEPNGFAAADVRAFYEEYEADLGAHRRDTLAHFYHPEGATIVFDGERMQFTHAGLDSLYKGDWEGPLFLAFDSLHWQPISPSHGIVTGGFRWLPPGSADTVQYIYLSVLERTAAGLRILVEHETTRTPLEP